MHASMFSERAGRSHTRTHTHIPPNTTHAHTHILHKQMAPVLRAVEGRYKDKINFVAINGDTAQVCFMCVG